MKKHFYLHTSKLDIVEALKRDESFVPCPEYNQEEKKNQHQFEYGLIKTKEAYYHLILQTRIKHSFCPWCGCEPELQVKDEPTNVYRKILYYECQRCMSRGPNLNALVRLVEDEKEEELLKAMLKYRYEERLPWDYDLVNRWDIDE